MKTLNFTETKTKRNEIGYIGRIENIDQNINTVPPMKYDVRNSLDLSKGNFMSIHWDWDKSPSFEVLGYFNTKDEAMDKCKQHFKENNT